MRPLAMKPEPEGAGSAGVSWNAEGAQAVRSVRSEVSLDFQCTGDFEKRLRVFQRRRAGAVCLTASLDSGAKAARMPVRLAAPSVNPEAAQRRAEGAGLMAKVRTKRQ